MGFKNKVLKGTDLLGFIFKVLNAMDEIMAIVAAWKLVKANPTEEAKDALIAACASLVDAVD
jgi:hypothetical protein